jgi:hypothetical protein
MKIGHRFACAASRITSQDIHVEVSSNCVAAIIGNTNLNSMETNVIAATVVQESVREIIAYLKLE